MHRLLWTAILCAATACSNDTAEPLPSGPDFSEVEALVEDNLHLYQAPSGNRGLYLALYENNQPVYQRGWGGYTENTRFPIASCSKLLSGAVLLSLVDDGILSLDDQVGDYLPGFPAAKRAITLRQLFSHTSGFPGDSDYESDPDLSLAEAVDAIGANVPLSRVPGSGFEYGRSVSMDVAGRMAEIASGKDWNTLFAERIAGPCGMAATAYDGVSADHPLIGGGAWSTPADYLRFLEMLSNDGNFRGTQVLSAAAVDLLFTNLVAGVPIAYTPYPANPYTPYGPLAPVGYSFGAWTDVVEGTTVWEISSPGAFGSHPWVDRKHKRYGILFTLVPSGFANTGNVTLQIRQAFHEALGD